MSGRSATQHQTTSVLEHFHPVMRQWFEGSFSAPTVAQQKAWPRIAGGEHTLLLAPTGSGKTLAAFMVALNRIMFPAHPSEDDPRQVRVLYISPLKALGVDVERNLRSPLAGVRAVAQREGIEFCEPQIGVRSGDTPARDREQLRRHPPDILITTPESLYLMLTSRARAMLSGVETIIIDEIHSMVATKRGAHLFLSLERLEQLRKASGRTQACQRIGLSATQRPLEEVARMLGGADWEGPPSQRSLVPRSVSIVEAGRARQLDLKIEVPVDDMSRLGEIPLGDGPTATGPSIPSIWPAIHPRLIELIRSHHSTMIFVNNRRLAERLATSINEQADEELALAHHGSIAKDTRVQIEDRLKRGLLPAIVATSSLELGIDMGAVDLVIQIESPPTIASGIQRIGRAGHQVGAKSSGIIFPKYRGDLLACAAAAVHMVRGEVEETFYARNPLDVLAQQIVAIVSQGEVSVDEVYELVCQAASFHELPRSAYESVLDLLSGRYPSSEFSELRPRLNWDRVANRLSPRKSSQRLAVTNAGTIPDRGLYSVFLADNEGPGSRVGELDEEMVYETRPGEVFLLGASSWRVMDITSDRVLVTPAPGEDGKMPFWRGDGPGRPLEFGQAIGRLARQLLRASERDALQSLTTEHALDRRAAQNLMQYLAEQKEATGEAPTDRTIVVESFLDEIGDWRVAILTPFGARIHAPWAMAVASRLRETTGDEIDMTWTDDGIVLRIPEAYDPPSPEELFPDPDDVEDVVVRELGGSALFAGRFRENAARALLLPRRQPGRRTPLWLQRRRAADLLSVAARYPNFPMILETYRECLRDVFDLKGMRTVLRDVRKQVIRVHQVRTESPSPFAASLMFSYTGSFLYDGDTPLAERRARSLALDHSRLSELLGSAELRELLCPDAVEELGLELQRLTDSGTPRDADALHDLLRHLGDLSPDELRARVAGETIDAIPQWLEHLVKQRRVIQVRLQSELRWIAVEDAAKYRDALGIVLPPGLPAVFLQEHPDPVSELILRFARTHLPFGLVDVSRRLGLATGVVQATLDRLVQSGRLLVGEFLPARHGREWTDPNVLRVLKRRSLARLRKQVEPVDQAALGRFLPAWQGVTQPRRGLDGLLDTIEQLQGTVLAASVWEEEVLRRRMAPYRASDLDELCTAGEVVWRGFESLGAEDGKISLYLADHAATLAPPPEPIDHELADRILQQLRTRGALFFDQIVQSLGDFQNDILEALWRLVWAGHVSNDTLAPLRSRRKPLSSRKRRGTHAGGRFRSRRSHQLPGSEGRWSCFLSPPYAPDAAEPSGIVDNTSQQVSLANQLAARYGILTRELIASEGLRGSFAGIYPVLKAMEEAGKLRRGYFVEGLGAAQFAAPGAEDRLRHERSELSREDGDSKAPVPCVLAATDPANPYGSALAWPQEAAGDGARFQRVPGARVFLVDGQLIGYLARKAQHLRTLLPADQEAHAAYAKLLAQMLVTEASQEPIMLSKIDGDSPERSSLAAALRDAGFVALSRGWLHRGSPPGT